MSRNSLARRAFRRGARIVRSGALFLPTRALGTVTSVVTSERLAALTFDDGPDPESTPQLLDTLERYGARATFFVVGEAAQRHADLLRRMFEAGHALGNHSWDHPSFPAIGSAERRRQITACEAAIGPYSSRLFRPPYANQDLATMVDVRRMGFKTIAYDVTGTDWRDDAAEVVYERLARGLRPGSILLLHDSLFMAEEERYRSRRPTLEAVGMLLERHSRAYRFVTVPELLRGGRPKKSWWYQPGDPTYLDALRRANA
jgi:peptidoglycan/xylan/chitin deacetylase (PgdA/CDA1 family)